MFRHTGSPKIRVPPRFKEVSTFEKDSEVALKIPYTGNIPLLKFSTKNSVKDSFTELTNLMCEKVIRNRQPNGRATEKLCAVLRDISSKQRSDTPHLQSLVWRAKILASTSSCSRTRSALTPRPSLFRCAMQSTLEVVQRGPE